MDYLQYSEEKTEAEVVMDNGLARCELPNSADEVRLSVAAILKAKGFSASHIDGVLALLSPQSPTIHAASHPAMPAAVDAVVAIADAYRATSHVAYALTDVSLVFPGAASEYLGRELETWAARGGVNAFEERGHVHQMQTRPGAAGVMAGTLAAGLFATALAPSEAMAQLAPTIASLVSARLPGVFHLTARSVHADLSLGEDHAALERAAKAGAAVFVSSTPQEAHDVALLAHALAIRTRSPVVHFLDAVSGHVETKVRLLRYHELGALVDDSAVRAHRAAAGTKLTPPVTSDVLDDLLNGINPALGAPLSPFMYEGHPSPDTVLVALGTAAVVAAAIAARLAGTGGVRVGVVRVLVVRPWSHQALLAAIPASASRVAVLSFSDGASSLLAADVGDAAASVAAERPLDVHLLSYGSGHGFSARDATRLLAELGSAPNAPIALPTDALEAVSDPVKHRAVLWSLGPDGLDTLARATLFVLAGLPGASNVRAKFRSGEFVHGTVAVSQLTVTGALAASPLDDYAEEDAEAATILVSHMALVDSFDVFAPLLLGGTVILNATPSDVPTKSTEHAEAADKENADDSTPAAVLDRLSSEDKRLLAKRHARVVVINAAEVAKEAGLPSCTALVLQAALFLARGPTEFQHAAPHLEAAHRALLPADKHAALVKLYAAARRALVRVPIPQCWASLSASLLGMPSARPAFPQEVLMLPAAPTAFFSLDAAAGTPAGVGPAEWKGAGAKRARAPCPFTVPAARTEAVYLDQQRRRTAFSLMFPQAFDTQHKVQPLETGVFAARVTENRRLTPLDYDRNIFHLEIDIRGTGLTYDIGSALGVHGHNPAVEVASFLAFYGLDADGIVAVEKEGSELSVLQSTYRLFQQDLDIFGQPGKDFYEALAPHAADAKEAAALRALGSDADAAGFKARADEAYTYADVLREFPSAHPPLQALIALIPHIKPRHYSIASSMKAHPGSVHLLVVEVAWTTAGGRQRVGQCSHYLAQLRRGADISISVLPSEMHLPTDPAAPVIMAGLGTGMAPFRAFIQERAFLKAQGVAVGPMVLYFGSRHKAKEYLYGEELEQAAADGLLTLRLAFSRDGPQKVYIQHLMLEDAQRLWALLQPQSGSFYLCGPTWPEPDVEEAIASSFDTYGKAGAENGRSVIKAMKEAKRYVLEVY